MEDVLRTQLAADGLDAKAARFQRAADARYVGQGYELRLELPQARIGTGELGSTLAGFHALHEREYGHHFEQSPIELDLMRRRATRSGQRIQLTAKEFALLELLMRHASEVLPRSMIASQVWDMNFDSDTNVIDVAIRRLRAKIDDSFEPKLIHTVRGMGYMLDESAEA
jgi:DNA-binding response OmpR family regulator